MRAVIIQTPGGPDQMVIKEIERPKPDAHQILVKVAAAGINRADIMQREGRYPPPQDASTVMGLEISGTVEETGGESGRWNYGDKVFGLIPGGGYAGYAVIHKDMAMSIPENFSFEEASAIPEVFLTAFQATRRLGRLAEGESILIHAGASGVGTAAIQLARVMGASKIIITASARKHDYCLQLGAHSAIDYHAGPFREPVMEETDGAGVNVIIDFIAGPYFKQNLDCLKTDGRMILLATLGGGKVDAFDMRQILMKRLQITGSTLRSRTRSYQIQLTKDFSKFALDRFRDGTLKPVIDKVYDWTEVAEAHRYMEANKNVGKLVLKVSET